MADETQTCDSDTITERPRTPNDPYTRLTETQIKNIQKRSTPHFHTMPDPSSGGGSQSANGPGREGGRHYVDRYAEVCKTGSREFGYIGEKHSRFPDERYNTSRAMASVRWGPNKAGERTRSHYYGETIDRYTTIDMYRRNPSNYPGRVTMDHGRPGDGYYTQKYPCRSTYFGSSVPLNRTEILTSVYPRTLAQYTEVRGHESALRAGRTGKWPEYTEYTSRYTMGIPVEKKLTTLEEKKRYLLKA